MAEEFIGNYKILKKIGAGGMAQVFLAVHKDVPNLKVVLKILTDSRLADRFRQEADKLALLDGQSNVCRIKHFFNHGDDFVIAMEFIDGSALEDMIKKDEQLPVAESLKIISDVLETLEFAHQKDIFHRDIKPGNIMVDKRSQVKIIDFGIAKSKTDPNLTIAGTSCGTPAYMPPEQFNPTEAINYALVDVYAVGTTLYYMLTGELPYKGDNQFALRDAKMFNDPPNPRELNSDIPKKVGELIVKALARDPGERFESAIAMKTAIDALRGEVGAAKKIDSPPPTPETKPQVPPGKPGSKKLPIIVASVVIVCAAIVYLILSGGSDALAPPQPLSPPQNAIINMPIPTFSWQGPDEGNVGYTLEYASDSSFVNIVDARTLMSTEHTPSDPLTNGTYYWHVQTIDNDGNRSDFSSVMSFTVNIASVAAAEASLVISVRPRGDIYIDEQKWGEGESEATAILDTGWHDIRVTNRQSKEKSIPKRVYLADGASDSITFAFSFPKAELEPDKVAVADSGDVIIGSRPIDGALVIIDGVEQDDRTNFTFRRPVGSYKVEVILVLDGQELSKSKTVEFKKGVAGKEWFDFEN